MIFTFLFGSTGILMDAREFEVTYNFHEADTNYE